MLYYLTKLLADYDLPGARLMDYISFRSGIALILSLFISMVIGKKIIERLQLMQVGEIVRDLGLEGQLSKKGTPTMGGIIIIISILIPCLLIGKLDNIYMILMIISTLWLGTLGFADDYIKVAHHDKDGLKGKFKIIGQVGLGLIVGLTMYLSPDIVMRENVEVENKNNQEIVVEYKAENVKSTQTTIPFVKNNNFDYAYLTKWLGEHADRWLDSIYPCYNICHYGCEQRSESHRWTRRTRCRHISNHSGISGYHVLSGRSCGVLVLS